MQLYFVVAPADNLLVSQATQLLVLADAPEHPVAEAALNDTLLAVTATPARRHVVVLAGEPGPWLPRSCTVVRQRGDTPDARLAAAFGDCDLGGSALLVTTNTPQLTPGVLRAATDALEADGTDAVVGEGLDGGWWAIGLRRPDPMAFLGAGGDHVRRFRALGLEVGRLAPMRLVGSAVDARVVARDIPGSRFAAAVLRT